MDNFVYYGVKITVYYLYSCEVVTKVVNICILNLCIIKFNTQNYCLVLGTN